MNIFPLIAIGHCTTNDQGKILDVRYDQICTKGGKKVILTRPSWPSGWENKFENLDSLYKASEEYDFDVTTFSYSKDIPLDQWEEDKSLGGNLVQIHKLEKDEPIKDVKDAYLKLYLLSLKWVKPNSLNLDGIFSALPNVAWTNLGPMDPSRVEEFRHQVGNLHIRSLDKFPCLTDYVIPPGVRIADTSRVRLGAYLSEGTTVMHEGFVNFNAGTLGPAMIEGRISAGVVIGANSDLGGGCSTMGTLSGGNNVKISVGEDCLLGANSGLGIPLGNRCIVEAGLYITAGTKVELIQSKGKVKEVKASELAFKDDLLFIRNSLTGKVQCKPNPKKINLNEELHSNN